MKNSIQNPEKGIALYYQVENSIREKIENGEWEVGQKLPTEPELCQFFGVSRTTIRQAVGSLVSARSIGKKTGLRYIRYPSHNSQKPLKFSTKQYCLPVHLFSIPAKRYGALLQKSSSDQYRPHYHAAQTATSCQR